MIPHVSSLMGQPLATQMSKSCGVMASLLPTRTDLRAPAFIAKYRRVRPTAGCLCRHIGTVNVA